MPRSRCNRRILSDWLKSMDLLPAGALAEIDRYIGYWEPYATNHISFEKDQAMQEEIRNAARSLFQAVVAQRAGNRTNSGSDLKQPARNKLK